ncbi:MAG: CIA30 family protein [Planctomycetia bacterium]
MTQFAEAGATGACPCVNGDWNGSSGDWQSGWRGLAPEDCGGTASLVRAAEVVHRRPAWKRPLAAGVIQQACDALFAWAICHHTIRHEFRIRGTIRRICRMELAYLSGCFALLMVTTAMAEDTFLPLFDFSKADAPKEWQAVNDGVMGGVSEGKFRITDDKTMEFFGTLSLENNGGFASVRSKARKLGLETGDTLVAKVRGDGRAYTLNLYPNRSRTAFSYRATVKTEKDQWIEIRVPLSQFEATSFGRVVRETGGVKPEEVTSIGVLLGDKKAGPFRMEIEWIKVQRAGK